MSKPDPKHVQGDDRPHGADATFGVPCDCDECQAWDARKAREMMLAAGFKPSRTPSGDGPDAKPSRCVDWPEPASDANQRETERDSETRRNCVPSPNPPPPRPHSAARAGAASDALPERETPAHTWIPAADGTELLATVIEPGAMGNASHAPTKAQEHGETTPEAIVITSDGTGYPASNEMGKVSPMPASESPALDPASRAKALAASVMNRLKASKQWFGLVDLVRDQMMKDAKASMPDLVQRQLWVYAELDRMYPPPKPPDESDTYHFLPEAAEDTKAGVTSDSGSIQGLTDLPKGWPEMPASVSLGAELAWVQSNRLKVVEERPGRATLVKLASALSPAPSWSALGWLETSIRSYAKFVDVAAKVSGGTDDDEGAVLRRERKSVDEIKSLLASMEEATGACPTCCRSG